MLQNKKINKNGFQKVNKNKLKYHQFGGSKMVSHSDLISIFLIISGIEQEKQKKSVPLEKLSTF